MLKRLSTIRTISPKMRKFSMKSIANFEVLSPLGQGSHGRVFKVQDTQLNKIFALKVFSSGLSQEPSGLRIVEQKFQAVAGLTHPHLVAMYSRGVTDDKAPYVVMDYVDGQDLAQLVKSEGMLEGKRATGIFIQASDGLSHAHEHGIIHGNLKPTNVLLAHGTAGGDFAKVADFEICLLDFQDGSRGAGIVQTTYPPDGACYFSPERCKGENLDQRSDIYSLGCVMYEALTGKPPFWEGSTDQIKGQHLRDSVQSFKLTSGHSQFTPHLEKVVFRCLAKDPVSRYQSMISLRTDLERIRDLSEQLPDSTRPCPKCKAPLILAEAPGSTAAPDSRDTVFSAPQTGQSIRIFSCGRYETKHATDSNWTTHHSCKPMKCACGKAASVSLEGRAVVLHCAQGHDRVVVGRINLPDF
jgi:eukaryotic-like serine/threonine-protein kinase